MTLVGLGVNVAARTGLLARLREPRTATTGSHAFGRPAVPAPCSDRPTDPLGCLDAKPGRLAAGNARGGWTLFLLLLRTVCGLRTQRCKSAAG